LPERETMELKKAIEALLFSSARAMKLEEIAALVKSEPEKVKEALKIADKAMEEIYEIQKKALKEVVEGPKSSGGKK